MDASRSAVGIASNAGAGSGDTDQGVPSALCRVSSAPLASRRMTVSRRPAATSGSSLFGIFMGALLRRFGA